ncbi:MAG: hypothetical protein A2017_19490 [Lentisphaerae bacterium GWF2_44_16]|nr:MAG: hypothetical protein A2017_19490 [Lentisphaerae bacterium GWF2_44_16]HAU66527.1 hypothetical protein [Candidatus Uhrbacteria bacterium]
MFRPTNPQRRAQTREEIKIDLLRRLKGCGKTFTFDETHDKNQPIDVFFQETHKGLVLFVIFYTQACRWMVCSGCTLPSTSSQKYVDTRAIMAQTRSIFQRPEVLARAKQIKKVIVSNQGSMLDQETFSTAALCHFVAKCIEHLPNMEVLTLESRPEYIEESELLLLAQALQDNETPATLEIAIGLEMFDKHKRNHMFRKGLSNDRLQDLAQQLARHEFRLKCYFMFKPILGMSNEEAIEDVRGAITYLGDLQHRMPGSSISIHLNPTYVGQGTPLKDAFDRGEYLPPRVEDLIQAIRHGEHHGIPIFVGLNDEGLAVAGGSFVRPGDETLIELIAEFNRTQDYRLFDNV